MKLAICVTVEWAEIRITGIVREGATYTVVGEFKCGPRRDMVSLAEVPPYLSEPCDMCGHRDGFPRRWFRFLNDPDSLTEADAAKEDLIELSDRMLEFLRG